MAWPTDTITTTYLDAGTDDPSLARAELKTVADKVKDIIAGRATASGVCDLDASALIPAARLSASAITTALGYTPWHAGNDGTGTGLDADLLDGVHAAAFLKADGSVALTGDLDINGQDVDDVKTLTFVAEYDNGNSGAAKTIDWNNAGCQKITLTGNAAITMTDPLGPGRFLLKMIQDGTGSRNPSWDVSAPQRVYWVGGAEPAWSTAANAVDIAVFYFDGTNYYGQAGIGFA
jgi:hypothetical protein